MIVPNGKPKHEDDTSQRRQNTIVEVPLVGHNVPKSVLDRVSALLALFALSPLIAVIAIVIRLDSPGNPIYSQERVGKDGRKFTAYKFRTMTAGNDDSQYKSYIKEYVLEQKPFTVDECGEPVYKIVGDNRVTRFGAFLRRTNLDEIPQFLNVLKGDMSLVGPRPDIPYAVQMYRDWHLKRLQVKPGITGLWQVSHRNGMSFDRMVQLDIEYIDRRSIILDARIALRTVAVMFGRDGSYR